MLHFYFPLGIFLFVLGKSSKIGTKYSILAFKFIMDRTFDVPGNSFFY